jgi:hypothetical protein
MELNPMYPPQAKSPATTTVGALAVGTTEFSVSDASVLPSAPTWLTIGADSANAETVLLTDKNGNTLTVTRAQQGTTARSWAAGVSIQRTFTAADHQTMIDNLDAINDGKPDAVEESVADNFVSFSDTAGGLADSGKSAASFQEPTKDQTVETAIADADYFTFYDTSAAANRKTLWSNIKSVLKTYFDTLYAAASALANYVPTTRKINDKALSSDITLSASDVSAVPASGGTMTGPLTASNPATGTAGVRNIYAGTDDMTAGESELATGAIYFVYE